MTILSGLLCSGCAASGLSGKLRIVHALRSLTNQKEACFSVTARINDETVRGKLYWNRIDNDRWIGADVEGLEVYLHDETLYFGNGRGYDLSDYADRLPLDFDDMLWGLVLADLKQTQRDGETVSTLRFSEDLLALAVRAVPEVMEYRELIMGTELTVAESGVNISSITLDLNNGISIQLTREAVVPRIPTELLMELLAASPLPAASVEPLFRGALQLSRNEGLGANGTMQLECGPLPISDAVGFTCGEGTVRFHRGGKSYGLNLPVPVHNSQMVLGLAVLLCQKGDIAQEGDRWVYTLVMEPETVAGVFRQLLPEAVELKLAFEEASFRLTGSEERWESVNVDCRGSMPFFITELPIRFSMELELGSVDVPIS